MGVSSLEPILNYKPLGFHYCAVVLLVLLKITVWVGASNFPAMHGGSRHCIEQKEAEHEHEELF